MFGARICSARGYAEAGARQRRAKRWVSAIRVHDFEWIKGAPARGRVLISNSQDDGLLGTGQKLVRNVPNDD